MITRVLVLGGDGMLGRMLRIRLAANPVFQVEWTSRRENSGAHFFQAESLEALSRIIERRVGYDYVVNCIALLKSGAAEAGDPSAMAEANRINAEFPHTLVSLAAESRFRLLHVSTDAVFPPESGRCSEADMPQPGDFYGRTKLLGEPRLSPHALTLRCSIIGPNPVKKQGLFEWVAGQPANATIKGYGDQLWNGITTLQFANLCATIFQENLFQQLRDESSVHHFCPNAAVTKYELVQLLCRRFRPDIQVECASGGTITRVLETRGMLRDIFGTERPMDVAIEELSTYIDGPKAADR